VDDGQRRLRVAFVVDTINGRLGGGVAIARLIVDRLRQEFDVRVVASDAVGPADLRLAAFQLPLRVMKRMEFAFARPDSLQLASLFSEVEVVHLHLPFWLSFVALRAARRVGRPVVSAFHVQPENVTRNVGVRWSWLNRWLYRQWVKRFYDRTDVVVCPTRFAERKLREHGLRAQTRVIPNGVPPDLAEYRAEDHRPLNSDGLFVVLAAGRFSAEKRQDVLLEAVRRSRHRDRIKVVLAGAGPLETRLRRKAAELPNGAQIGFFSRAQLAGLFASSDLFVHCGEVELEGIAVVEAMSMGLPVIVAQSPESAASEFALEDAFRFQAGDVETLARRIDALIDDPAMLTRARARYREIARSLDFAASVQSLSALYRSLVCAPAS
jgi:glycosyltransferase involved in cell wall biosynthesis